MGDNIKPDNRIPGEMNWFYRFFCWCSGSRLYLLKQCPTEYNKYLGIGAIVLFTGILAALTGGYALYTVFNNVYMAVVLGLFWGLLIFFLDWYIVSSLRKENQPGKEFASAAPRLLLSLLLAVVISKPLELRLFQNEINKEIETIKRDSELNYKNIVFEEFDEISNLETANENMYNALRQKENERLDLFNLMVAEAEGRSPTQRVGKGSVYKEKKQEYDKISKELERLSATYQAQIENNMSRINNLKENRDVKIERGYEATANYNGFLARLEAMGNLTSKNKHISFANWFIVILFILLESSPVIVKLMSKRGPYDVKIEADELAMTYETEKEIIRLNTSLHDQIEKKKLDEKYKLEAGNKVRDHYYRKLAEAGMEVNEEKIEKWRKKESERFLENFDDESMKIRKTLNLH